jgi:hypothetical protein
MTPYTREDILSLKENQPGVYGIFRGSICVYVGSSEDIRGRMLDHVNGDNPCIDRNRPDRWTGFATRNYLDREIELTLEYEPRCNKRVG